MVLNSFQRNSRIGARETRSKFCIPSLDVRLRTVILKGSTVVTEELSWMHIYLEIYQKSKNSLKHGDRITMRNVHMNH